MADPAAVSCTDACAITLQLSGADILNIDTDGGAAIASSILVVWAVGYGFRLLIRTLSVDRREGPDSEG